MPRKGDTLRLKILLCGPCQSGKTTIANFLADGPDLSSGEYRPTQGVRILEFESDKLHVGSNRRQKVDVELWDCSGDRSFESYWPAFVQDAHGVIFVYDPGLLQEAAASEMDTWFSNFIQLQGMREEHCIVFCHQRSRAGGPTKPNNLSAFFNNVKCIQTNLDCESNIIRQEFNTFLQGILKALYEKRDQEEMNIINTPSF